MTLTGRLRLSLILAALLPPLLVMAALYFYLHETAGTRHRQEALRTLARFDEYLSTWKLQTTAASRRLADQPSVARAIQLLEANRPDRVEISLARFPLDYAELVDSNGICRYSINRPGLVGEKTNLEPGAFTELSHVQYDLDGPHTALTAAVSLDDGWRLVTGRYFDSTAIAVASQLIDAPIKLAFAPDVDETIQRMEPRQIYAVDTTLQALLWGGASAGFYLTMQFPATAAEFEYSSLLYIAGIVAVISVGIAILLGLYFTGRAKREVENLVAATQRIADGDFVTPVMAYEEGEFSQLADSFTDMIFRLRRTQEKLAMSEKIAAWQAMARKIAHEVKNPLSPIAISADDLRQSYREKLPDFEKTLQETTGTIKNEVRRLNKLLDEFVAFARMAPPEIKTVPAKSITQAIEELYRNEATGGRLSLDNASRRDSWRLDPDAIQRLLVNLIKNALETGAETSVAVSITDDGGDLVFAVRDSGPGFPEQILRDQFVPYLSTKPEGSGLGLVISQRIAFDHGGGIAMTNHEEGGGVVTVRLPQ